MQAVLDYLQTYLQSIKLQNNLIEYQITVELTKNTNSSERKVLNIIALGSEILGLYTDEQHWWEVSQDKNEKRALFFRSLNAGKKERIELKAGNIITGDLRKNTTEWYYDDWELPSEKKLALW